MKDFLKQHPWRLEILPFFLVIAAAIVPLMHWQQMLAHTWPLPGLSVGVTWLVRYVARVLAALVLWVGGWQTNEQWVLSEREKRYNFWAPISVIVIGAFGWAISGWMSGSFWLVITLVTAGLQAIIEARRPFVLLQRPSPHDTEAAEVRPGDRFYYHEGASVGRASLLGFAVALVFVLGFVRHWDSVIYGIIMLAIMIPIGRMYRREISITREKITGRFGPVRLLIPMTDVCSCTIADPHPLTESFRGHRGWGYTWDGMQLYGDCTGPMLRIDTAEGKTYLLGIKKPETACGLVRAALSQHS